MSDVDRSITDNIALSHFEKSYQIKDRRNRALANIYTSLADRCAPVFGTIYLIHGYGGSPVEPCMKIPAKLAHTAGFDVVAIEGIALSATSGTEKQLSSMTLARQKRVIARALQFCADIPELTQDYRISWTHSMSGRAIADLTVQNQTIQNYFNEHVLANPYFVPPARVWVLFEKMMRTDPTGRAWRALTRRASMQYRTIENVQYAFPACLYNLNVPLPQSWPITPNDVAARMHPYISDNHITFLLGTADNMAEYAINVKYFDALPTANKNLVLVDGANHSFENEIDKLYDASRHIIDDIRTRQMKPMRQKA